MEEFSLDNLDLETQNILAASFYFGIYNNTHRFFLTDYKNNTRSLLIFKKILQVVIINILLYFLPDFFLRIYIWVSFFILQNLYPTIYI